MTQHGFTPLEDSYNLLLEGGDETGRQVGTLRLGPWGVSLLQQLRRLDYTSCVVASSK